MRNLRNPSVVLALTFVFLLQSWSCSSSQTVEQNGNREVVVESKANGAWQLYRTILYNSKGQEIKVTMNGTEKTMNYSESGKLIEVIARKANGTSYTAKELKYDEQDRIVSEVHYNAGGSVLLNKSWTYDPKNGQATLKEKGPDGQIDITKIDYNSEGNASKEVLTPGNGPTTKIYYRYTGEGKLAEKSFFQQGELTLTYRYLYDKAGRLHKKEEQEGPEKKVFLTETYEYNDQGKITSIKCSSEVTGACAGDTFKYYNQEGNLERELVRIDGKIVSELRFRQVESE